MSEREAALVEAAREYVASKERHMNEGSYTHHLTARYERFREALSRYPQPKEGTQ